MRPICGALCLGAVAIALGCEPPPKANQATSPAAVAAQPGSPPVGDPKEAFLAAFRKACESKSADAMLSLYCLDGVDAQLRETIRENIQDELAQPLTDLQWEPAEPGKYGPTVEGGVRWKPNLEVVAVVKAKYAEGPSGTGLHLTKATHAVGLKGGRYLISVRHRY